MQWLIEVAVTVVMVLVDWLCILELVAIDLANGLMVVYSGNILVL